MRVAILGGGLAGLAAAYECEQIRQAGAALEWYLFEASGRLGGTLGTTRRTTPAGDFLLEDGPDGWLTEKTAARQLVEQLGLGDELITCNEASRRTYVRLGGALVPMPGRMRLMVPEDITALEGSTLFTDAARTAYARELARAEELRTSAPAADESVASFVHRHFGDEVLNKVAAPLLSGVFGGDVQRLSVRAVMPNFVALEQSHGSLIAGLAAKAGNREGRAPQPTFTSLRRGMGSLTEALVAALPAERIFLGHQAAGLQRTADGWLVRFRGPGVNACAIGPAAYDALLLATPVDTTRALLQGVDLGTAALVPTTASSAVLATLCWPAERAMTMTVPPGFGFLVPPSSVPDHPQLLAATFADQKYPHRAPHGAKIIRAFFGELGAAALAGVSDEEVAARALAELTGILGPLPAPASELTTVRHWPRSLPQYEVGHLGRMGTLERRVREIGPMRLLGNGYRGVGVPDVIQDARAAARDLTLSLNA